MLTLSAVVLRIIQLSSYTNTQTGYIFHSAKNSIIAFYIICAAIVVLCSVISYKTPCTANPFDIKKGSKMAKICYLAGASLFYDFVHQCLNCYEYISKNSVLQFNYIIPLIFLAVSALACTYYFYILGSYFNTQKYDFMQLKYFHLMPAAWIFFRLLICFNMYSNNLYAVDVFFQYLILIFGIIFYILIVNFITSSSFRLQNLAFVGMVYSIFSLIISVPRLAVCLFGIKTASVTFSSVTYMLTGVFALAVSVNILREESENVY